MSTTSNYPIESFNDPWDKNPKDGKPQSVKQMREFLKKKDEEKPSVVCVTEQKDFDSRKACIFVESDGSNVSEYRCGNFEDGVKFMAFRTSEGYCYVYSDINNSGIMGFENGYEKWYEPKEVLEAFNSNVIDIGEYINRQLPTFKASFINNGKPVEMRHYLSLGMSGDEGEDYLIFLLFTQKLPFQGIQRYFAVWKSDGSFVGQYSYGVVEKNAPKYIIDTFNLDAEERFNALCEYLGVTYSEETGTFVKA